MSSLVISGAKLLLGAYDLSGDVNALALKYGAETKDSTSISAATRTRAPGLKDFSFQHEGFWNGGTGAVDDALFNSILGVNNVPMTIGPLTGAEGELCYFGQVDTAQYSPGAKIGDMLAFSVAGGGNADLVRGSVLTNAARTVTGTGTIFNLGAVGALQKLWGALHFTALGGSGTLVVKIQSAPTVGFAAPTDHITFSTLAAIGSQFAAPVNGAITDAYWRASWTISGFSSCTFAVPIGIQ